MSEYNIDMNLRRDFEQILLDRMQLLGIQSKKTGSELIIQYLTTMRKLITSNPRRVVFSQEFTCPDECQNGLNMIVAKIVAGDDLSLHLSKSSTSPNYNDKLLNDWGIHHLHLGTNIEKGRYKRTGPLLFAHFTDDTAYLINIFFHGSWTEKKIMQIIINNWGHLLSPLNEIKPTNISDKEHTELRNNNLNVTPNFGDNIAYMPLGGGMMVNGINFNDLRAMDITQNKIDQMEETIREKTDEIAQKYYLKTGSNLPSNLSFRLHVNDETGNFSVFEPTIKLEINMN